MNELQEYKENLLYRGNAPTEETDLDALHTTPSITEKIDSFNPSIESLFEMDPIVSTILSTRDSDRNKDLAIDRYSHHDYGDDYVKDEDAACIYFEKSEFDECPKDDEYRDEEVN